MQRTVYFDNSATTPMDGRVLAAMRPFLEDQYGNPSSLHGLGRTAHEALDRARLQVADLLGGEPGEIVFTSGGTEADNLALIGAAYRHGLRGFRLVASAIEHPAVLETCR
jgi:cysteine desulfurase